MIPSAFDQVFGQRLGPARCERILAALSVRLAILLTGAAGTGKSTLARILSERIGGSVMGTGSVTRARARERGFSLVEYASWLQKHPDEEIAVDADVALAIARGDVSVAEGRLVAHLGGWLRRRGRTGLLMVKLSCDPREQAVRLLGREMTGSVAERARLVLSTAASTSLADCAAVLRGARDAELVACADALVAEIAREHVGWRRAAGLYDAVEGDCPVDLRLDGTTRTPGELADEIVARSR